MCESTPDLTNTPENATTTTCPRIWTSRPALLVVQNPRAASTRRRARSNPSEDQHPYSLLLDHVSNNKYERESDQRVDLSCRVAPIRASLSGVFQGVPDVSAHSSASIASHPSKRRCTAPEDAWTTAWYAPATSYAAHQISSLYIASEDIDLRYRTHKSQLRAYVAPRDLLRRKEYRHHDPLGAICEASSFHHCVY